MLFNREARPAPSERDYIKAEMHVARFREALAQCVKPHRKAELERHLAYWQAVLDLKGMR